MYTWRGIVRLRVLSVYGDAGVFGKERGKGRISGDVRAAKIVSGKICAVKGGIGGSVRAVRGGKTAKSGRYRKRALASVRGALRSA